MLIVDQVYNYTQLFNILQSKFIIKKSTYYEK